MIGKLVRFGFTGGITTLVAYVVFSMFLSLGVHYLGASTVAWAAGLGASFVLNRIFTFQIRGRVKAAEAALFIAGNVLQLLLGLTVYGLLIGRLGMAFGYAFILNTAISALFSFAFMNAVVFPIGSVRDKRAPA
jgi:putative flippase GtrA